MSPDIDPPPPSVTTPAAAHRSRRRRRLLIAIVSLPALLALLATLRRTSAWAQYDGPIEELAIDLSRPDVLIRTRSLSQLPRELLKVPLFRDLLTEDFVFYYEQHPDRLGLLGSLRRIAYEHELTWTDRVLDWALDQPAQVALWRDGKGRLRHWVLASTRPELVKLVHEAAIVAAKDRRLTLAGRLTVDGDDVELLAIEYGARRVLLVAAHGDRVVALSQPGLVLAPNGDARAGPRAVIVGLLTKNAPEGAVFAEAFALAGPAPEHSVLARVHFLSLGYQHFFPGFEALRFDFGAGAWSTHALFDPSQLPAQALDGTELWRALPANPSACTLLPADWRVAAGLAARAHDNDAPDLTPLIAALQGPAAVCWYPRGRLVAPLVVVGLQGSWAAMDEQLGAVFGWAVRGGTGEPTVTRPAKDEVVWKRTIEVPFANLDQEGAPQPGPIDVTFARHDQLLLFSPDHERVEQALATLQKRYPSVADTLPGGGATLAVLSPKALAEVAQREALVMLPRGAEPVFRGAAERLLLPRLDAMGSHADLRLSLPLIPEGTAARGWSSVTWEDLAR